MASPGDWMCGACQHINFKKRDSCQRCSCPKFANAAEISAYNNASVNKTEMLAGDWYCTAINCTGGVHNYASRTNCFRCGALKYDYYNNAYGNSMNINSGGGYANYYNDATAVFPGWKTGDWICSRLGCGVHNYACRTECYKCKTARDYGGGV